jgi:hypothetical protein
MRHYTWFILYVIAFYPKSGSSQNEYFADNPKWGINEQHQWSQFDNPWGKKTTLFVDGDTLLNEEVFVKIFEEGIEYYGLGTENYTETPYTNPLVVAYLRSEGMKMYKWDEYLNIKELLYDFDANVGEQFNLSPNIFSSSTVVESISYTTLGGVDRKVISILGWGWEGIFIEGVGHLRGLWHPNNVQLDFQTYLVCFSVNGEPYYASTDESPWLISSLENCEFEVSITEIPIGNIKIYPNPTNYSLNIESNSQITSIVISDFTGRTVHTQQPNSLYTNVNVESLPSGYYIVHTTSNNYLTETSKLFKN